MPVRYIDQVRRHYSDQPAYRWSTFETIPWASLAKPLSQCRIALLSSAGIHLKDQDPFSTERDDLSWREIPTVSDPEAFRVAHHSKNATNVKDFNTVLPLEALKQLSAERVIASVAPVAFTFMGRIFKRTQLQNEMAPAIVSRLRAFDVDAAVLVPV
jgi:D-proline reductase (dithiol) PrdB